MFAILSLPLLLVPHRLLQIAAPLLLTATAALLNGQSFEQPLRITGMFSTGFYTTSTRGIADQSVRFVPFGAKLDINGHFISPDFLSFSAAPEMNLGPQASEAGFQGGNGIRFKATFLRKRIFPVTFRYSNLQVEDVYFGSLSQVSAYSLRNRTKDLGVTWEFNPKGLPSTIVDWGTGSVDSKSDIALVPDYKSKMQHLNIDTKYQKLGWDLQGLAHWENYDADLVAPLNAGSYRSSLQQDVRQTQGSANRSFWTDSGIYLTGGGQTTSSVIYGLPINLDSRFASANMRLFQKRRWKVSLRAGYASNLSTQFFAQAFANTAAPGIVGPDPGLIAILNQEIANINFNATTNYNLGRGFGLYGIFDQSDVISSSQASPLNASYFSTTLGGTYTGNFRWGRVSGQYGRDFGNGSITGQSGTIQGQTYLFNAQHGQPDSLLFEGSVHGTNQRIENAIPIFSDNLSVEGSVSRRIGGGLRGRIGGGYQWGSFRNGANEFNSGGYTARISADHPRLQLAAALNNILGSSLPVYSQLLGDVALGGLLLPALRIIPSDFRAMSFTAHSNPIRRMEVSASWTRSLQHLDRILNNDFELLDIRVSYKFRKLVIDSGYIRANQLFANYPQMRRGRFYIRVSRNARIL